MIDGYLKVCLREMLRASADDCPVEDAPHAKATSVDLATGEFWKRWRGTVLFGEEAS